MLNHFKNISKAHQIIDGLNNGDFFSSLACLSLPSYTEQRLEVLRLVLARTFATWEQETHPSYPSGVSVDQVSFARDGVSDLYPYFELFRTSEKNGDQVSYQGWVKISESGRWLPAFEVSFSVISPDKLESISQAKILGAESIASYKGLLDPVRVVESQGESIESGFLACGSRIAINLNDFDYDRSGCVLVSKGLSITPILFSHLDSFLESIRQDLSSIYQGGYCASIRLDCLFSQYESIKSARDLMRSKRLIDELSSHFPVGNRDPKEMISEIQAISQAVGKWMALDLDSRTGRKLRTDMVGNVVVIGFGFRTEKTVSDIKSAEIAA